MSVAELEQEPAHGRKESAIMNQAETSVSSRIAAVDPVDAAAAPAEARNGSRPPPGDATAHLDRGTAGPATDPPAAASLPARARPRTPGEEGCCGRKPPWPAWAARRIFFEAPTVKTMLNTISTRTTLTSIAM